MFEILDYEPEYKISVETTISDLTILEHIPEFQLSENQSISSNIVMGY